MTSATSRRGRRCTRQLAGRFSCVSSVSPCLCGNFTEVLCFQIAFSRGPAPLAKAQPNCASATSAPSAFSGFGFVFSSCASAVNPELPRPMNADARRRGSSVVDRENGRISFPRFFSAPQRLCGDIFACGSAALRGRMVACAPTGTRRWPARIPVLRCGLTTRRKFSNLPYKPMRICHQIVRISAREEKSPAAHEDTDGFVAHTGTRRHHAPHAADEVSCPKK